MAPPLLTLKDIHLTFGGTPLLEGAELTVEPGDRICLVGRNGSGKSTLLEIAAGLVQPDSGERFAHPGAIIRYLPQEADFTGFATARAFATADLTPLDNPHSVEPLLAELGLDGDDDPARYSGGEGRRLAIVRALAGAPSAILLDEPTNHLDLPAIEWLERRLASTRAALVLVSHDRRFLETLSRTVIWIDRGVARRMERGFAHFEAWRDSVLEEEAAQRHKLDRKIAREDQWMHGGVTARRKRNVRRVRELQAMRQERREQRRQTGNVRFAAAEGQLSGRLVLEAEHLSKSFDGRPVVADVSLRILRGDRVGIVGPNGAGKTTLVKLLTGALAPDAGSLRLGVNLDMVTLDQKRDELDPNATVADALTGGRGDQVVINGQARHVASYMKDFLFLPEQARSPLSVLSGGERGRLMLARALAKPSNFLVLDEPTNDLDLETLDLLQELLSDYPGTVLLVSHDRDFLDRVVTSVVAAEGDGKWIEYAGGYSDMIAQRAGAAAKATAAKPRVETARGEEASIAPPQQTSAPRKLSFKEKHALQTLPDTIARLEAEVATLQKKLADPAFFSRDAAGFAAASARLAAAEADLASAETQWLELEIKRSELEG